MGGKRKAPTAGSRILERVRALGPGSVFTASDFLDLANPQAVYQALIRLAAAGTVRKVARGVYEFPRIDPTLGAVAPDLEAVARALQDRHATRLIPSGAHAAHLLGLSTQVPVRAVFLTDGRARTVTVGRRQLLLRHAAPRFLAPSGRVSAMVIQALRWIGRAKVDAAVIDVLRSRLSAADKAALLADLRFAPAWIGRHMRDIAASGSVGEPKQ